MPARPLPVVLLCLLLVFASRHSAQADLRAPDADRAADSASVQLEQGVEFRRLTEYFSLRRPLPASTDVTTGGRWRTMWLEERGAGDRVRQDGLWYAALRHRLNPRLAIWAAGSGEHFDERSRGEGGGPFSLVEIRPTDLALAPDQMLPPAGSVNSTRILRGGAGATMDPWKSLRISSAFGLVDDRRIGQHEAGIGSWNHVDLKDWDAGGWLQNGSLAFLREVPRNHHRLDLTGSYDVFREFFPGNHNRLRLEAGLLQRDILLTAGARVSRRAERYLRLRDRLEYEVAKDVSVSMEGDLKQEVTDLDEKGKSNSALEEEQAGLLASIQGRHGPHRGRFSFGVRSVSQTIRGDILIGRKTEMSLQGQSELPDRSVVGILLGLSKYTLDTRSDFNNDDRDELGLRAEGRWRRELFGSLVYELHVLARLDHLVYIFEENSANNRWSRLFLLGTDIAHQPLKAVSQTFRFAVSANYQDYDFEFNPKTTRSTVFRRYLAGDSIAVGVGRETSILVDVEYEIEELGRLYWDDFEESRSDETQSWYVSGGVSRRISRDTDGAVGYVWDSRRGVHFGEGVGESRSLFQNLRSYGPTASFRHGKDQGFYLRCDGRFLRQLDLNRDPRWIVTGELMGGIRW